MKDKYKLLTEVVIKHNKDTYDSYKNTYFYNEKRMFLKTMER